MPGRQYEVSALLARHNDYVLVQWVPWRGKPYPNSWVPVENLSHAPASNALTRHAGWFEALPEWSAAEAEAAQFRGLGP